MQAIARFLVLAAELAETEGRILLFPSVASYQEHCQFLEQLFVRA